MQNDYNHITQILLFFSLVPVLRKLPDHHNLPLFNDMLHFWYQSRVSLFVLWDISCQSKQSPVILN